MGGVDTYSREITRVRYRDSWGEVPNVGQLYAHVEADTIWGQDVVYAADDDRLGSPRSDRQVIYAGDQIRVDAFAECIDTTERDTDDEPHHVWTKKLPRKMPCTPFFGVVETRWSWRRRPHERGRLPLRSLDGPG